MLILNTLNIEQRKFVFVINHLRIFFCLHTGALACGEGHFVLIKGVEHEDGDVEEDYGRMLSEGWRLGFIIGHIF